jgi:hypothetical protein
MTRLVLITLLVLGSGPANAEWMPVHEIAQLATTVSVDPDTIHRKGDLVELWVLFDSKTTQSGRGGPARSTMSQAEFDCEAGLSRVLAVKAFSGNMGSGTVVFGNSDEQQWEPVQPDSVGQTLWRFACSKE